MSCSSKTLRIDHYLSGNKANYKSALLYKDGRPSFGLLIIKAPLKGAFSFGVQGIHQGSVTVHSDECGIDSSTFYKDSSIVHFTFNPDLSRCLLSITVNPDFENNDGIKWNSLSGVILMKRDERNSIELTHQIPFSSFTWFSYFPKESNTKVFAKGCGEHIDTKAEARIQTVIFSANKSDLCVLEGFFKNKTEDVTILNLLNSYDASFAKLPQSFIEYTDTWEIYAPSEVSFISINGKVQYSNQYRGSISLPATILFYTTAGRASYCFISLEKEISCLN